MRESLPRGTMKAHETSSEKEIQDETSCRLANETAKFSTEEEPSERRTGDEAKREVLGWPGVSKETERNGPD
jgi:hypothetical protein